MKHQHCHKAGNAMMAVGLIVMVSSIFLLRVRAQPAVECPDAGAAGAGRGSRHLYRRAVTGDPDARQRPREDRYFWYRRYDKRCRRTPYP